MVVPALNPRNIGPGAGRAYRLAGELVTVKATAAESGGAYALFEAHTAPAGGAPAHRQRYEDEAVYVLEGTYAARVGAETRELGPGAYAFVPRETVHAFANRGATAARMLVLVSPGEIHERFIAAVGTPAAAGDDPTVGNATDMARLTMAGPKYGVEFVSTPLD